MKRNSLLAKSLTLGLAVATAAASMSTPGGLVAPVTAYAEDQVAVTEENIGDYFEITDTDNVIVASSTTLGTGVEATVQCKEQEYAGAITLSYKTKESSGESAETITAVGEYDVYITAAAGTGFAQIDTETKLGTVTVYQELDAEKKLTYKNGSEDTTGVEDVSDKVFTDAVTVDAGTGNIISLTAAGLDSSATQTVQVNTPVNESSDPVDGEKTVILYVKLSGDDSNVYAKKVTLKFDVTAPTLTAAVKNSDGNDEIAADSAILSVSSTEKGKVYYVVKDEKVEAPTAATVTDAGGEKQTQEIATASQATDIVLSDLSAYTDYYVYLIAEDEAGNLGEVQEVTFKTARKTYDGTQPAIGTFTEETRALTYTFTEEKAAAGFEYSLDGGQKWVKGGAENTILVAEANNGSTTLTLTIPAENEYESGTIMLRVAEAGDHLAGAGVAYDGEIKEGVPPTLEDITAPTGESLKDISAIISVQSNEKGNVYYLAQKTSEVSEEPDAATVKAAAKSTAILTAGTPTSVTISELTANTEYVVYVVAEDEAGNLSAVKSVSFTTAMTALTGTASLEGTAKVGQELTASLSDGNNAEAVLTYTFIRVKPATENDEGGEKIVQTLSTENNAETANKYTILPADVGCTIKVKIEAAGLSGAQTSDSTATVEMKDCEISLGSSASLFGEVTGEGSNRTLPVTLPEGGARSAVIEYTVDKGDTWQILSYDTNTGAAAIPLENKTYASGDIQVRVKADTATGTNASAAVSCATDIKATLAATVVIDGELKYNQTITANATITDQAQEGAVLKYKFIRVTPAEGGEDDPAEHIVQEESDNNKYKLTAEDIGSTIKVVVTAEGYDDGNVTATTATIQKADAREVADVTVTKELSGVSYNYTVTALGEEGAKYGYVEGAYESYQAAVDAVETLALADTNTFGGLTPSKTYTFFATYDQTDTKYEQSAIKCLVETVPLLQRLALSLNVTVSDNGENGKNVTITNVENAEYSFEGDVNDKYDSTHEKSYTAEQIAENATITVAIRYPHSEIYEDVAPLTQTIDLSKEYQEAPAAATVTFATNATSTKYVPQIRDVEDAEKLEYSVDGGSTWNTEAEIEALEFDANQTITLYTRKAACTIADKEYDASSAVITTETTPDASAAPTIKGAGDATTFTSSLDVTLEAEGENPKIYYTTDGKTPTITSTEYKAPFKVTATTTIKAIAVVDGKIVSTVTTQTFTKQATPTRPTYPSYSGGSSSSGGSTTTPSTDDKKDDTTTGTTPETKPATETKPDGTQITTTETKAEDGSSQAKVEIKNDATGVKATVSVAKDASGKVTDATAAVTQTSADKSATISAALVSQITEAAGTKDVTITTLVVDEKGKKICRITVDAEDLTAGSKMAVLKINSKTGEKTLINKSVYEVAEDGSVVLDNLKLAKYALVTKSEADAFSKEVLKTVKVESSKKSVTAGKKTKITLDDGLNMDNVAKITYTSSKKSVATVNKNGTIVAKKAGKVTVKATVTLKNGKTKTVKMTITVKNPKKK